MNTWYCPNGKAFMREICLDLRDSVTHYLVELPIPLVRDFTDEFTQYSRKYLSYILVKKVGDGTSRDAVLRELFNIPDNEPVPPAHDLLRRDAADHYILLEFSPSLSPEERQNWMAFLADLDLSTKQALDRGAQELRWKVIAVLPGSSAPYRPDMGIKKIVWWGFIHSSDMEYAAEQFFAPVLEPEDRSSYYWLYSLCRGLASSDPMLAEWLVNDMPLDLDDVGQLMSKHPLFSTARLFKNVIARMDGKPPLHFSRTTPPEKGDEAELWKHGLYVIDCFGNPSLHPAALAAASRLQSLERRIVLGQMQVYLPIVQEVHGFLCRSLRRCCGSDWNKHARDRFTTINDEIGALPAYMRAELSGYPPLLYDLAAIWREMRNTVAHNHMITSSMANDGVNLYRVLLANEL